MRYVAIVSILDFETGRYITCTTEKHETLWDLKSDVEHIMADVESGEIQFETFDELIKRGDL